MVTKQRKGRHGGLFDSIDCKMFASIDCQDVVVVVVVSWC